MANQFLVKETMAAMRGISAAEITALQNGTYEGVQLLGYYRKGDTPAPIHYYVGSTQLADDGFSVIVIQNIKLVHRFIDTIDVSHAGCSPDIPDNSLIINKVINYASLNGVAKVINRQVLNIVVKEASLTAGGIELKSNVSFENLGKLTMSPTSFDTYAMISGKNLSNVQVIGGEIIGDRLTHTGTGGEHGMGVYMFNCKDFIIRDLKVNNCWGDGICLGGHPNPTLGCKDFTITNVISTYNRRQGLSIGNADQGIITDSEFSYSAGTNPQSGIDIEPNGGQAVSNLMFQNIICNNNANTGFQTYSQFGEISNIIVNGLSCIGNGSEGILFRHPKNSNISLSNVVISNSPYGAVFRQGTKNISVNNLSLKEITAMGIRIIDNSTNLDISTVHSDSTVSKVVSVFEATNLKLSQFVLSGSYVELAKMYNSLLENWKCGEVTAPNFITLFSGSDNTLKNIAIVGQETMSRGIFLDSLGAKVNNRLKDIYIANAKVAAIEANNVTDINLVDSYFYNNQGAAHVKLGTAVVGAVISNNIFKVSASATEKPQYCIQLANNHSKIRIKLNDYNGAFSANDPIAGIGTAFDSIYMLDSASTSTLGMVRLSSNIGNADVGIPSDNSQSTATNVSGIVSDFNSLVNGYNSLLNVVSELQTKLNAKLDADRNSGQQAY